MCTFESRLQTVSAFDEFFKNLPLAVRRSLSFCGNSWRDHQIYNLKTMESAKIMETFVNQLVNKQCCTDFALYECDLLSSFWISLSLSFFDTSEHIFMTPTNFIHIVRTAEHNLDCNNTITVIENMRYQHICWYFATTNINMLVKRILIDWNAFFWMFSVNFEMKW